MERREKAKEREVQKKMTGIEPHLIISYMARTRSKRALNWVIDKERKYHLPSHLGQLH